LRLVVVAVAAAATSVVLLTHSPRLEAAPIVEPLTADAPLVSETLGVETKAVRAHPIEPAAGIDVAPEANVIGGWLVR